MTFGQLQDYVLRISQANDITLRTHNRDCFAYTDHTTIYINSSIVDTEVDKAKVLVDHEVAHIKYPLKYPSDLHTEYNLIDDYRIEHLFVQEYPGVGNQFTNLRQEVFSKPSESIYGNVQRYLAGMEVTEYKDIIEAWYNENHVKDIIESNKIEYMHSAANALAQLIKDKMDEQPDTMKKMKVSLKLQECKENLGDDWGDTIKQAIKSGGSYCPTILTLLNVMPICSNVLRSNDIYKDLAKELSQFTSNTKKQHKLVANGNLLNSKHCYKVVGNTSEYYWNKVDYTKKEKPVITVLLDASGSMMKAQDVKLYYSKCLGLINTVQKLGYLVQAYAFNNNLYTIKTFNSSQIKTDLDIRGCTYLPHAVLTVNEQVKKQYGNRKHIVMIATDEACSNAFNDLDNYLKGKDNLQVGVLQLDENLNTKIYKNFKSMSIQTKDIEAGFTTIIKQLFNMLDKNA